MSALQRQRTAAGFKAPDAKERDRIYALGTTPNLPGIDGPDDGKKVVRTDLCWRLAEKLLIYAAQIGGYHVEEQRFLGKAHGRRVKVDMICSLPRKEGRIVISCKWQRAQGSFEEKIPAEAEKLQRLLPREGVTRAYLVLVGPGCDLEKRLHWTNGSLDSPLVKVVDLDFFLAAAWCQEL